MFLVTGVSQIVCLFQANETKTQTLVNISKDSFTLKAHQLSLLFLLLMLQTAYFLCTLLISKSIKLFCEANVAWSVYGVSTVIVCNGSYNIH